MQNYPSLISNTVSSIITTLRRIIELRKQDITDFNNLNQVFLSGRKVGKVPANSADITSGDRVLDWNYDNSYVYWVLLITGSPDTLEWRRIAHANF